MTDYRVGAVPPEVAARIWPHVEGFIAKALKRTGMDRAYMPTDILACVLSGEMLLWAVASDREIAAVFVTRINQYPRCRTCNIFLLGGKQMNGWLPQVIAETESYARRTGCIGMQIEGRDGWVRAAGYVRKGAVMFKELGDG